MIKKKLSKWDFNRARRLLANNPKELAKLAEFEKKYKQQKEDEELDKIFARANEIPGGIRFKLKGEKE